MVTSKPPPPRRPPFKGGSNARGYINSVMAKTTKTDNSIQIPFGFCVLIIGFTKRRWLKRKKYFF
jgi:hypothetical protein